MLVKIKETVGFSSSFLFIDLESIFIDIKK